MGLDRKEDKALLEYRLTWQIPAADWICLDGAALANFQFLAQRWLMNGCAAHNDCDGADLNHSDAADTADLILFAERWLRYPDYR